DYCDARNYRQQPMLPPSVHYASGYPGGGSKRPQNNQGPKLQDVVIHMPPPPSTTNHPPRPVGKLDHPVKKTERCRNAALMSPKDRNKRLNKIHRWAKFLDSAISCCGLKFGLDSLVGLIPVAGDFIGVFCALLLTMYAMRQFHLPTGVKCKMFLNIFWDWLGGLVPFIGDYFDFLFKANIRNYELVEKYVADAAGSRQQQQQLPPV
ncbi:hypothetical protein EV182_004516, partial [Spiromyces aspiralis]